MISDESSYINGQSILVDGGWTAKDLMDTALVFGLGLIGNIASDAISRLDTKSLVLIYMKKTFQMKMMKISLILIYAMQQTKKKQKVYGKYF